MCENCRNEGFGRRDILKFGAAAVVALGLSAASRAVAGEGAPTAPSPDER